MAAAGQLGETVGTLSACQALGVARSSLYRGHQPKPDPKPRPRPERALTTPERETVLETLHSERFVDQTPAEVHATLLDEGTYLCSVRTMYRLLTEQDEVRERYSPGWFRDFDPPHGLGLVRSLQKTIAHIVPVGCR